MIKKGLLIIIVLGRGDPHVFLYMGTLFLPNPEETFY
jgi:hypothetical protein